MASPDPSAGAPTITQARPLDDRHPRGRLEAARAAAANARGKAQAYADGIGATLGPVLRLVEAVTELANPFMRGRAIAIASAEASGGAIPIDPGAHEVSAEIDVTFVLEPS